MNKIKNFKCECGGDVLKLDDGYECTMCKLKVYNKFMNYKLSDEQIQKLFYSDMIECNNIKLNDGYIINAQIYSSS
ncbi:MAG: hypothetical protein HOF69_04345 [Campylobacteraceae bacterium]|jgi:hypothetical protein|nr:hypothetical protein [Campylobacteraceae bacterium]MBT3882475.1 hypothetical protein [Campylobacteraceae bacterium]MBT4031064.1 hypothetical protein [Campylobacteraceae bacterium]MBT4179891.1 hypothetical protein [Campylobacteraceae bacterium]MBT4572414.1 hypothetical protein [Campylobacteraceae bacterium]